MRFNKNNSGQIISGLLKTLILIQFLVILSLTGMKYSRFFLNSYFNRGEVEVPDLKKQPLENAMLLAENQGLGIKIIEKKNSISIQENRIISQIPEPGRTVRPGRKIQVVLSMGALIVSVPEVIGKTYRTAGIILRNEGFSIGKTAYINDDSKDIDTVIAQYPPEGSMIPKSTPIDLMISLGKGRRLIKVPNFIGLNIDTALGKLTRAGLTPGKLSFTIEDREPLNIVLAQLPKKDLQVEKGSTVDLLINGQRPAGFSQETFSKSFSNPLNTILNKPFSENSQLEDTNNSMQVLSSEQKLNRLLNNDFPRTSGDSYEEEKFSDNQVEYQTDSQTVNTSMGLLDNEKTENSDLTAGSDRIASQNMTSEAAPSENKPYMPGFNESEDSFGYFSSSMKKDVLLDFIVPQNTSAPNEPSRIKMILIDVKGISKIYDSAHKSGENLSIQVTGYGKVKILIYVNNTLTVEKNY